MAIIDGHSAEELPRLFNCKKNEPTRCVGSKSVGGKAAQKLLCLWLVLDAAQGIFEATLILLFCPEHRTAEATPPRNADSEEARGTHHNVSECRVVASIETGDAKCQKAKQEG